jgi:hypothetical protein
MPTYRKHRKNGEKSAEQIAAMETCKHEPVTLMCAGGLTFDCHQIVTKTGAKLSKTLRQGKSRKEKSSLSYGRQRDLVEFSTR